MSELDKLRARALREGKLTAEDNAMIDIAKQIEEERTRQGLTQRQLAEKIGVRHNQICRIENLDAIPKLSTLLLVLSGLGMSVELVKADKKSLTTI